MIASLFTSGSPDYRKVYHFSYFIFLTNTSTAYVSLHGKQWQCSSEK
jgi:uncharacterized protein affecting Mg2+/Co2+ transport